VIVVEKNIVDRINEGDAKAFEQLYDVFYVYLYAVATKYIYPVFRTLFATPI
jgi:RNA polymerase sigma-70 factor (ECF subfamily)